MELAARIDRFFERYPRLAESSASRDVEVGSIRKFSPYLDRLEDVLGVELVTLSDIGDRDKRGHPVLTDLTRKSWPTLIEWLDEPLDLGLFGEFTMKFKFPEADIYWDTFERFLDDHVVADPRRGFIWNVFLGMATKRTAPRLLSLAQMNLDDGSIIILFRKIKQLCGAPGREFLESLIDHPTFHITARKVLRLPKLGS